MAKAHWGIELGTSSIKAAKVEDGKDGLRIADLAVIELRAANEDLDETHEDCLRDALIELREQKKIKGDPCFISIPGHQTFNRLISVPYLDPKSFDETVRFEAQQNMPVAMDQIIWDKQLVDPKPTPGDDTEVALFAVRREIVQKYIDMMGMAGLTLAGIQVAPLAIYNYVKFDQKFPKSGIIIDIGAENTDLVIIEDAKVWIRNVPSGGAAITKALAQRFKIPMEEAEKLKIKAGKSKQAQKIFAVMKPALRDMLGEIHRSVGFYKSQHPSVKLDYMMIMGSGAHLLGLQRFFEQNLQHKVVKLSSLKGRLRLARSANPETLQSNITTLAVALGLALQATGYGANTINLVPDEIKQKIATESTFPKVLVGAALCVAFSFLPLFASGQLDEAKAAIKAQRSTEATADANKSRFESLRNLSALFGERRRYTAATAGYDLAANAEDALFALSADPTVMQRIREFNAKYTEGAAPRDQPLFLAFGPVEFSIFKQFAVRGHVVDGDSGLGEVRYWADSQALAGPTTPADLERSMPPEERRPYGYARGRAFGAQLTLAVPIDKVLAAQSDSTFSTFLTELGIELTTSLDTLLKARFDNPRYRFRTAAQTDPDTGGDDVRLKLKTLADLTGSQVMTGGNYLPVVVAVVAEYLPVGRGWVTRAHGLGRELSVRFVAADLPTAFREEIDPEAVPALLLRRDGSFIATFHPASSWTDAPHDVGDMPGVQEVTLVAGANADKKALATLANAGAEEREAWRLILPSPY